LLLRNQDLFVAGLSDPTGTEAPPAGPTEKNSEKLNKPCFTGKGKGKEAKESRELSRITCR